MKLASYDLAELTPERVRDAFDRQQSLIVRNAVDANVATRAYAFFKELMQNTEKLTQYPFEPVTRVGYTPPGVETLQRGSKKPDRNRSMFDVGPGLMPLDADVAVLFQKAADACQTILVYVDEACGTQMSELPKGGHTLRTAQGLLANTTSANVLFPRHRDFSLLTAFIGSGVPGLEIQVEEEWYPLELAFGDLLIGTGTPFTQFLPEVEALCHRVVGGVDYRLASFLFFDLDPDVVLPKTLETYGAMLARVLSSIRV